MGLVKNIKNASEVISTRGMAAVPDITYEIYANYFIGGIGRHLVNGENIYEKEWDVLIIMDGCRKDLLESVQDEYDYINDIGKIVSLGAYTKEWMTNTFTKEFSTELSKTVYITGNPFSEKVLNGNKFESLDEVWRYGWDEIGTVLPEIITDRAIQIHRNQNPNYMIIHYMQPHVPFIKWNKSTNVTLASFGGARRDRNWMKGTWMSLRKGKLDFDEVLNAYRNNLRLVLNNLELLLNNMDANQVVISSDHGNAMGEWGIYGHPPGAPLRCIREVPWAQTSGEDQKEYFPDKINTTPKSNKTVQSRLEELGYI